MSLNEFQAPYQAKTANRKPTILNQIEYAVSKAGYTYDFYTGENHSGLDEFLKKKVQVLIASRPISTGVDGLQKVCQNYSKLCLLLRCGKCK